MADPVNKFFENLRKSTTPTEVAMPAKEMPKNEEKRGNIEKKNNPGEAAAKADEKE